MLKGEAKSEPADRPERCRGSVMLTRSRGEREQKKKLTQEMKLRRETYAPSRFCTET